MRLLSYLMALLIGALATKTLPAAPQQGERTGASKERVQRYLELAQLAANQLPEDAADWLDSVSRAVILAIPVESADLEQERQSALLALGYFFDFQQRLTRNPLFKHLLQDLESEAQRDHRLAMLPRAKVYGRRDLGPHFFVAASLTQQFGAHHTSRLTLSKELGDGAEFEAGIGTGFSFADVCANEAGIRFGQLVQQTDLRQLGQEFVLTQFLPPVDGLEEGLTQTQLEEQFGGSNGDRFQSRLRRIQERISLCPGFATTTQGNPAES